MNIAGNYIDHHKPGLLSEMAILNLFDPCSGMLQAVSASPGEAIVLQGVGQSTPALRHRKGEPGKAMVGACRGTPRA